MSKTKQHCFDTVHLFAKIVCLDEQLEQHYNAARMPMCCLGTGAVTKYVHLATQDDHVAI